MGRFRRVLAVLGVLVGAGVGGSVFAGSAPASASSGVVIDDPVGAARLLVLANEARSAAGLVPLELRYDVFEIAAAHSQRMATAHDLFHNDAYFTPEVRRRLGARTLGENVALNSSMDDAHARLMNSPDHRANLLNPKFTIVGMAVTRTADGTGFVTQDFVEPSGSSAPAPAPQPEPATAPSDAGAGPSEDPDAPATPDEGAPEAVPEAAAAPATARARAARASRARVAPAPVKPTLTSPAAGRTEVDATATQPPAEPTAAPTTTARGAVSVVTAPISATAPSNQASQEDRSAPPLGTIAVALAAIALVSTCVARATHRWGADRLGS